MAVTVPVHITVGEPHPGPDCLHCGGPRFTFPLVGLLRTGVVPAGSLTVCQDCDTPRHVVRERVLRIAREGLRG